MRFLLFTIIALCVPTCYAEEPVDYSQYLAGALLSSSAEEPADSGTGIPQATPERPDLQRTPVAIGPAQDTGDGYLWTYSNGATVYESYREYTLRTAKRSPATAPCCTTGHCGSFTASPTLPAAGCACGCNAAACNCAHSPNVGRSMIRQRTTTRTTVRSPGVARPALPAGAACAGGQCLMQQPLRGALMRPLQRLFHR